MAILTPPYVHPDEKATIGAVRYFERHWPPADIRDPDALPSFSEYGVSRLDHRTPWCPVAGKASRLARAAFPKWQAPERAFNILLFAAFIVYCVRKGRTRYWPWLLAAIAPQCWYLCSYATSDALDWVLCTLAFYEAADEDSGIWRAVADDATGATSGLKHRLRNAGRIVASGAIFGLLSLGKKTVLAAFLVAGAIAIRRFIALPRKARRRAARVLAATTLVAALFPSVAAISENIRYDGHHEEIRKELEEKTRGPQFRPDENGIVPWISVGLRQKGISLYMAMRDHRPAFVGTTIGSFIGNYGKLKFPWPRMMYATIAACYLTLAVSWFVRFVRAKPSTPDMAFAAYFLLVPMLLIAASVWHSWTTDWQPQGRYLIPANIAYAALGTLAPTHSRSRSGIVSALALTAIYALSVWSFAVYGVRVMAFS